MAEAKRVVAKPHLGGQRAHAVIGRQDDVVVAVHAMPADLSRAGEATQLRVALVDGDADAVAGKPVADGQAEQAATDDPDAWGHSLATLEQPHAGAFIRVVTWRIIRRP